MLFHKLCQPSELERAWLDVLKHYERDKVPAELQRFDRGRGQEIARLARELGSRCYLPEPASLIHIAKPGKPGERREISLVKADDRIVLTLLNRLLSPLFERQFLPHSYAYRKGRGALAAVERVEHCLRQSLEYTAAGDIDDFFGSIDRERMLTLIKRSVWELPVLDLLETYLHMGATSAGLEWVDSGKGIAQGSPLSPLLSNVYLLEFDQFLDQRCVEWVRYGDNFVLLAQDSETVQKAFAVAERFLAETCLLRLNPDSRLLASWQRGFDFLGFWFQEGRRMMHPQRLDQKKQALSEMIRGNPSNLDSLVAEVRERALGWRHYYGSCEGAREQLVLLEQHLFDLLVPWMERYRSQGGGKGMKGAELKAALLRIELPSESDSKKKVKWVELLLARSRPASGTTTPAASAQTRRAVEKRKREFRKRKENLEEVLITRPGVYLGRTGERLLIRREGKREAEIPLAMVRNVSFLTTAFSISGEIMVALAARGLSVHLLGLDGKPLVRIGPPEAPSYHLSVAQARLAASAEGLALARRFVSGKLRNQGNLLRYFGKYKGRRGADQFLPEQQQAIQEIDRMEAGLGARIFSEDLDLERNRLFATEGQAASVYWGAIKKLLWQKLGFAGRVRRGAADPVNALLNYGYGMLYSRLLGVLVRTGLNVNIGFLHKPQPGKPGLLFDFIEEFRPAAVDRAVFALLNLGKTYAMEDGRLPSDARQQLARAVVRRLQSDIRYHGESMPLQKVMELQAELLVRHIEGKEDYKPFVLPW